MNPSRSPQDRPDIALCLVFFTRLPLPRRSIFAATRLRRPRFGQRTASGAVDLIVGLIVLYAQRSGLALLGPGSHLPAATLLTTGCLR
jgi:adenosylcobinamide-GDP ribazoletransferase